jgi:hypothetical protein
MDKSTFQIARDDCVLLINRNMTVKQNQEYKNMAIQDLFESGFQIVSGEAPRFVGSKMIYQALWRTVQRTKMLDTEVQGVGADEAMRTVINRGLDTVLDMGDFKRMLRDKNGLFDTMYTYGDAFMMVGANPDKDSEAVIQFNIISNSNIYVDSYATAMRSGGTGRNARRMCVIFSYSKRTYTKLYEKNIKENPLLAMATGKIPRDQTEFRELERDEIQSTELDDIVEVAHYYDLDEQTYTIFAGTMMLEINHVEGEDYPFILRGEAYIPVIHFYCIPSKRGFYNHGLGDLLYDYAILSRKLINMTALHATENAAPYTLISLPKGRAEDFANDLEQATYERMQGKQGFIPIEYDSTGSGAVTASALTTSNNFDEVLGLLNIIDAELKKLGINLQEISDGTPTATQIIQEEETSSAFVKQTMEYNASECQEIIDITMDISKEYIRNSNKTPVWMPSRVKVKLPEEMGGGTEEIESPDVTLGEYVEMLKSREWYVTVNARSGAIPSRVVEQAKVVRMLQTAPPGTPAYFKLLQKFSGLNDNEFSLEDFGYQTNPQQPPAGAGLDQLSASGVPADTERMKVSANLSQPEPAI